MSHSLFDLIESENMSEDTAIKIDKEMNKDIAIIGIGLKLPMADTTEEFWDNIANGRNMTRELPIARREDVEEYLDFCNKQTYQFERASYLEAIDKFDHSFFNISPKEASLMDPNQRMFLETALQAIEDAGYGGEKIKGSKTSVFLGYTNESEYKKMILDVDISQYSLAVPGNLSSVIASRIAYLLDLQGASMIVDTACSSSLMAMHLACSALRAGECSMAIAGGVQIHILPIRYAKVGIESKDNITRTFAFGSDGTGGGEGVIAFLLKPLNQALRDRDNIYAVIKGSACNQDGASMSLSAPNPAAQERVLLAAWQDAMIDPETISYIEAHGTGTKLGDPVEIEGIQRAFEKYTKKKQFCGVGSVKTNIGHLDATSGAAGLLKAVLSLKNKKIPPSIHFDRPNPKIPFIDSAVYVNSKLSDWDSDGGKRRSGVSSFSFCGTNCHMVLEEAPLVASECTNNHELFNILALSAKTKQALLRLIKRYQQFDIEKVNSRDMCYTANTGREHYNYRIAILFDSIGQLKNQLQKVIDCNLDHVTAEYIFYGYNELTITQRKQAPNRVYEFLVHNEDKQAYKSGLRNLCYLYKGGVYIDWEKLYYNEKRRRVSLPTYPFEPKRCWIDIPLNSYSYEDFYHTLKWAESKNFKFVRHNNESIVIFGSKNAIEKELCNELRRCGKKIIEADFGERYEVIHENKYQITTKQEDLRRFINTIREKKITKIVYSQPLSYDVEITRMSDLNKQLEEVVFSFYFLITMLCEEKLIDIIEIVMLTSYFEQVTSEDDCIRPEHAIINGLGKALNVENHNVMCRAIDLDRETSIRIIADEIDSEYEDYNVAYRKNNRYVQEVSELELTNEACHGIKYKEQGVYLITGGTGGLGLEIAQYLVSKGCKNIALINRSKLPPRETWNKQLKKTSSERESVVVRKILQMEDQGACVTCYSTDISKENEIGKVIESLRNQYGNINGIINSASVGVGKQGLKLGQDSIYNFKELLKAKVQGTWILNKLTMNDEMDFFVLFSSPITITGGIGSAGYIAANTYLDSFTGYRNGIGKRTISISWAPWKNTVGMEYAKFKQSNQLFDTLSTTKIIHAFERILNSNEKYVIVGRINYESEILKLCDILPFRLSRKLVDRANNNDSANDRSQTVTTMETTKKTTVLLHGRDDDEYDEIETTVAQAWSEVLGYSEFNIKSNFYEMGGDSIIAMKVINSLNQMLKVNIKITDLLREPILEGFCILLREQYLDKESSHIGLGIGQAPKDEFYPVSFAQKRILVLTNLKNEDTSWNMSWVWKIEGDLDIDKLNQAFLNLIKRHDILRTTFEFEKGEAVQKVHDKYDFKIELLKGEGKSIDSLIESFIQPYDLRKMPLMRVGYAKLAYKSQVLIFDIHHIIADASSAQIIIEEIKKLYKGETLLPNRFQYKDYTLWQYQHLNAGDSKKQEEYWMNKFVNKIPVLNLPTDYSRDQKRSNAGNKIVFEIDDQEIIEKLNQIVKETNNSMFTVLVTIYSILIWKLSAQEDFTIGVPIAGRNHPDIEALIGMFINVIVIRCNPTGCKTFLQLLSEIKKEFLEACDNSDYPFSELVQKLGVRPSKGRNPLFDISFVMQNTGEVETIIDDKVRFIPYQYNNKSARNDLLIEAIEEKSKIKFILEYNVELFSSQTIERFIKYYVTILKTVAQNYHINLSEIETISKEDRNSILNDFLDDMN